MPWRQPPKKILSRINALGICIDDKLNFNDHVDMYVQKPHVKSVHFSDLLVY